MHEGAARCPAPLFPACFFPPQNTQAITLTSPLLPTHIIITHTPPLTHPHPHHHALHLPPLNTKHTQKVRERHRGAIRYNPFSSKRKRMSVLVSYPGGRKVLYVKGAGTWVE